MKLTNEEKCTYCREYGNLPCDKCNKKSTNKLIMVTPRQKLILYKKPYLWRIIYEQKSKIEYDGHFSGFRIYKHVFFNAKIRINEGLFHLKLESHINNFCDWYENKIKYENL